MEIVKEKVMAKKNSQSSSTAENIFPEQEVPSGPMALQLPDDVSKYTGNPKLRPKPEPLWKNLNSFNVCKANKEEAADKQRFRDKRTNYRAMLDNQMNDVNAKKSMDDGTECVYKERVGARHGRL